MFVLHKFYKIMKYFNFSALLICIFLLTDCKDKAQTDPVLQEAFDIQHDAIHIGEEVESMIKEAMAGDTTAEGKEKYEILMEAFNDWKKNMVEVPGVPHDHSGHNHDHSHGGSQAPTHLSPEEIKQVQTEWKNAILAIKESLNQ